MRQGNDSRRRFAPALAAALAVHLGVVGYLSTLPGPSRPSDSLHELEVELTLVPTATKPTDVASPLSPLEPKRREVSQARSVRPIGAAEQPVLHPGDAGLNPELAMKSGEGQPPEVPETSPQTGRRPRQINLGLDPAFLYPVPDGSPRLSNLKGNMKDIGGLKKGLLQEDVEQGLSPGGIVAQLTRNLTMELGPGGESAATLAFAFGEQGGVTSVRVTEADSASIDWTALARQLEVKLKRQHLTNLPQGGYRIVLRVETKQRLPSGGTKPLQAKQRGLGVELTFDVADLRGGKNRTVVARIISEQRL